MRKWFVSLSLVCGICIAADAAHAQVAIQVQAQPAQPKPIQVQAQPAIQIQVQPIQIQADRVAIMPYPGHGRTQFTQADAVFVGRVVALERMDIEATQVPGTAKVKYRVAVVQVTESIFGLKKDAQQVRVAFVMQGNNGPLNGPGGGIQILPAPAPGQLQPVQPGFGPRRPFPGNFQMNLAVGQDGIFTVNKHPKENFYLAPSVQTFINRENNPGFDGQVKAAKQLAKAMADPIASLKSEDKQDRYTAAAVLINKYRNANLGQPMKLVPIDAAESKLILQAIAGGDWKIGVFNPNAPAPSELFNQLGLTAKDGYTPNFRTQQEMFTAMQKWLDDNNGKYIIQKYVVDPNAKAPVIQPGVDPKPGFEPGIRPAPPIKIRPGIQPLPAPVPLPAPLEIELPAQPAPVQPLPPLQRK